MENLKIIPEDLQSKFKSKSDLYQLLSFDRKAIRLPLAIVRYNLPPYEKCPMHFLRAVLCGEKKVLKKEIVIQIDVPRYSELSVINIWTLIKDVQDLLQYFPDYKENQIPSRKFMFGILATFRFDNARKNRSAKAPGVEDELIHITKLFYDEINAVASQKLSKGKASQMLKRCAKLSFNRKPVKIYQFNVGDLHENDEEEKNEDNI